MNPSITNLKGGAKLIFDRQTAINGIAIKIIFSAGALNDPKGKLGVAHFCEHAICSFSNENLSREEKQDYKKKSFYFNACTDYETMEFFMYAVKDKFEDAIDFCTSNFSTLKFSQDEFDKEKEIITSEINTKKTTNDSIIWRLLNENFIDDDNFANMNDSTAGNKESLNKISIDDLKEFIGKYISLDNLTISICGNIPKIKVVKIIKKYVETRLKISGVKGYDEKRTYKLKSPQFLYKESQEKRKSTIEIRYVLKNCGFSYETERERRIVTILRPILTNNAFSFFRTKKTLCYSCSGFFDFPFSVLCYGVEIDCDNDNVRLVLDSYSEFLESLPKTLPKSDFDDQKYQILSSTNFDFKTIAKIASYNYDTYYCTNRLRTKKYRKEIYKEIESVTYEEANKLYQSLFKTKPFVFLISNEDLTKEYDYNTMKLTKD
jgi:predicted Zn-dependent peptidase